MKISLKLALIYLRNQKGRSLALITSIALAVILVFTLNIIPETQSKLNIKEAYINFSDYHIEYTNLSNDITMKLKKDKEVKEIHNIKNFGNLVDESGVSISLNSYDKDFINQYGYKLIKGNEPQNENEIVLEEKALKEMRLKNNIGQTIDFKIVKDYMDENDEHQLFSGNKKLKLVGIIQKPEGYYTANEYYKVNCFIYDSKNINIIPKNLVGYNGILKLNTKIPNIGKTNILKEKYKLNDDNFTINLGLNEVLDEYKMSKNTSFSKNNKLIPIISSTLVIYNIFNIILVDMTKQIGMLRAIGLSKKSIRYMLFIQSIIVLIGGLIVGFAIGTILSYIGLRCIYGNITELYISETSMLEPLIMATASVLVSIIFIMHKLDKNSPIEAIRSTNNSKIHTKNKFYYKLIRKIFGITGEMAYKNVWRNKTRTIVCALSIALAGTLYISKMAVYNNHNIGDSSIQVGTMGKTDIILKKDINNTDERFAYYNEKYINEIEKIKEIKEIQPNMNINGFYNTDINNLSDDYIPYHESSTNKNNLEINLTLKGYKDKTLENIDNFILDGNNIINNLENEYPSALISNNFYSTRQGNNDVQILKEIKVNDLINIKIPVNKNGKVEYKKQKIRVVGILNKDYVVNQEGGFDTNLQVLLNEKDYKDITGYSNYNEISIKVEEDKDREVIDKLKIITEDSSFVDIESKYEYKNFFIEQSNKNKKTVLISVLLTLIISSINVICILRTNIMIRISEISTLRAIGMSMKKIKSMIVKESIMYGVLSTLIASIISTFNYYKFVNMVNVGQSQILGVENSMKFYIPIYEILQFGVATILICLVGSYLSKNKIEKLSIVDGLKINE